MSAATLEREGGDDRDPEVQLRRMEEKEVLYVSDIVGTNIGGLALRSTGDRMARLRGAGVIMRSNPMISRGPLPPV